ncbi:MAG: type I phosphodiesterase/nucleotide pyrophosphatase [uncultured bacterium]|nr:MAG: type I phosphodiesterase/nucleotide pyrophosphatase [uncultured bacterium]
MTTSPKVIVIGLDGATFKLLDPQIKAGRMPNLKRLIERGVRGTLLSTKPPVTVPAWTTFATGVQPGKHGCYDFFLPGKNIRDFRPATSAEIKVPTLYELLNDAGKKSILVNLPNSYPPRLPHQTLITDFMTYGEEYIFPASLKEKYPELKQYKLSPDEKLKLTKPLDEYIEHILQIERDRVAAVKRLMMGETWDMFFFLFSSTDWVSHLVFNEMATGQRPKAMEVFPLVDQFFGWLDETYGDTTNIYVMSDHGFTYYTELFYINRWLEQQGYLTTSTGVGKFEENATARRRSLDKARSAKKFRIKINKRTLRWLFIHPAIERLMKKFYHKIIKKILPIHVDVNIGIDLDKTKVCFPRGSMLQTLYLNYQGNFAEGLITDRAEYDHIRADVKNKLEALRTPSGQRVTEHVYTKEELYGEHPPTPSPDLHCATKDVWIVGHLHAQNIFENQISNKHDEFGVFMAAGPDIRQGEITEAGIEDITPTLLHHFGLAVPNYTDGKVLDIFQPNSEPAQRSPKVTPIKRAEHAALTQLLDDISV